MVQFNLQQECSPELKQFPQINEFGLRKINTIILDSFGKSYSDYLRIFYIVEGKFDWVINGENYTIYPTELVMVLPNQELYAEKGYLEIGALFCLDLKINFEAPNPRQNRDITNGMNPQEYATVLKIFSMNDSPVVLRMQEAGNIFLAMRNEIFYQEIGYHTRVNQLLNELLIQIARKITQQSHSQRDFPGTFLKLEESLRKDLSHPWTVEEMAALAGMGTTAFSDKVKSYTGFSPIHYLINIRISEATKLLKRPEIKVTDIALDTGFYSSQHFSTTFKKLTGYTPREFRNIHLSKTN